jgi:hypothetical protein
MAIEVLCAWHTLENKDGNFTGVLNTKETFMHEYYPCKFHLCSFLQPVFDNHLRLSKSLIDQLIPFLTI